jgi:hypothetical protein
MPNRSSECKYNRYCRSTASRRFAACNASIFSRCAISEHGSSRKALSVQRAQAREHFQVHFFEPVAAAPAPVELFVRGVFERNVGQEIPSVEAFGTLVRDDALLQVAILQQRVALVAQFLKHRVVKPGVFWHSQGVASSLEPKVFRALSVRSQNMPQTVDGVVQAVQSLLDLFGVRPQQIDEFFAARALFTTKEQVRKKCFRFARRTLRYAPIEARAVGTVNAQRAEATDFPLAFASACQDQRFGRVHVMRALKHITRGCDWNRLREGLG